MVGRSGEDRRRLLVCRIERWAPKRTRSARRRAKSEFERKEIENVVLDGVARLARAYRAPVVSDQHLARVVADGLRQRGIDRVVTQAWTGTLLTEAFRAIRARVIADTITFPRDETLVSELTRIRSRARAGGSAVEVPRTASSHQDSALALASAVYYLDRKGIPGRSRTWSSFRQPGRSFRRRAVVEANADLRQLLELGVSVGAPAHLIRGGDGPKANVRRRTPGRR